MSLKSWTTCLLLVLVGSASAEPSSIECSDSKGTILVVADLLNKQIISNDHIGNFRTSYTVTSEGYVGGSGRWDQPGSYMVLVNPNTLNARTRVISDKTTCLPESGFYCDDGSVKGYDCKTVDADLTSDFYKASCNNDLKRVNELVTLSAVNINKTFNNDTALTCAMSRGHHQVVQTLLKNRLDLDPGLTYNSGPLIFSPYWSLSSSAGNFSLLMENFANKIDFSKTDRYQNTVWHVLVPQLWDLLPTSAKAFINQVNSSGISPVTGWARSRNFAAVKQLLAYGASIKSSKASKSLFMELMPSYMPDGLQMELLKYIIDNRQYEINPNEIYVNNTLLTTNLDLAIELDLLNRLNFDKSTLNKMVRVTQGQGYTNLCALSYMAFFQTGNQKYKKFIEELRNQGGIDQACAAQFERNYLGKIELDNIMYANFLGDKKSLMVISRKSSSDMLNIYSYGSTGYNLLTSVSQPSPPYKPESYKWMVLNGKPAILYTSGPYHEVPTGSEIYLFESGAWKLFAKADLSKAIAAQSISNNGILIYSKTNSESHGKYKTLSYWYDEKSKQVGKIDLTYDLNSTIQGLGCQRISYEEREDIDGTIYGAAGSVVAECGQHDFTIPFSITTKGTIRALKGTQYLRTDFAERNAKLTSLGHNYTISEDGSIRTFSNGEAVLLRSDGAKVATAMPYPESAYSSGYYLDKNRYMRSQSIYDFVSGDVQQWLQIPLKHASEAGNVMPIFFGITKGKKWYDQLFIFNP